jgi:hypothetical protein
MKWRFIGFYPVMKICNSNKCQPLRQVTGLVEP